MPNFVAIKLFVPDKKIFKGFYHIWAWQPSWSCDPDAANKFSSPLPKEAPHKIGPVVSEENIFQIVDRWRTTTDGPCVYYKLIKKVYNVGGF